MMKPSYGDVTTSRSCSCTWCVYRSESDRSSVKQMLAQGSRIDKLYLGKYIPLRERKLLGKLVRTRAIYDDIRNQLLSESNISVTENSELTPKHMPHARRANKLDDAESSAILELVNLVDKGAALGSRRISECCSCCSCGSRIHSHEHKARHRHGRAHLSSRSSVISEHRTKDERRLNRHLRHKAKHVRSDPCTCTLKFSGMIKRESNILLQKLQGKKPDPIIEHPIAIDESQIYSRRYPLGYKVKLSGMGESVRRSVTKMKYSQSKLANNVRAGTKKSLDKLRDTKQGFRDKMSNAKKSVHEFRPGHKHQLNEFENVFNIKKDSLAKFREYTERKKSLKNWECDFKCHPDECVPEECFRIITRKRLRKRFRKSTFGNTDYDLKRQADISSASDVGVQAENKKAAAETATKHLNIIKKTRTHDDVGMNINGDMKTKRPTKKRKSVTRNECLCEIPLKTKSAKTVANLPLENAQEVSKVVETPKKVSRTKKYVSPLIVPTKIMVLSGKPPSKTIKTEVENKISQLSLQSLKTPSSERQAVRIGSSFSFSIEFYKDKQPTKRIDVEKKKKAKRNLQGRNKSSNTSQTARKNGVTGCLALKRCFCTLKLKPDNRNPKSSKIHRQVKSQSVTKNMQTMNLPQVPVLLPYECEPMVCIPGECNPIKCEKIIRKRIKHHSTMTKKNNTSRSTPSLTSKSVSSGSKRVEPKKRVNTRASKQDYSKTIDENNNPSKQAVRISSNFSFNVEFFKDRRELNMTDKDKKIDVRQTLKTKNKFRTDNAKRKRALHLLDKQSQGTSSGKSKYTMTRNHLRRCFCTLKFAKTKQKVNTGKSRSKATITSRPHNPKTARLHPENMNKSTEKKDRKNDFQYSLLPYECEPGICVPGECNPYDCLELINKRNSRTKTKQLGTEQRRTKSSYTLPRKYNTMAKSVNIEPSTNSIKNKHNTKKRRLAVMRETLSANKQSVRIGSTFSFDIEFYKQKSPFNHKTPTQNLDISNKAVGRKLQEHTDNSRQKLALVQAEEKRNNVYVQSVLKRCFCTLRLYNMNKNKKNITLKNAGNNMAIVAKETYPVIETVSKSTKVKNHSIKHPLGPYECEPYFCVPGECDPKNCLERINNRENRKSKEFGVGTNTRRRKSTSSSTKNINKRKDAGIQSYQTIKRFSNDLSSNISEKSSRLSRQTVKIGSNFSFNIEFGKEASSKIPVPNKSVNVRASKIIEHSHTKNSDRKKLRKQTFSQTLNTVKMNKATGIRPILKKCFCTAKLLKRTHLINYPTAMTVLINNQKYSTCDKTKSMLKHYSSFKHTGTYTSFTNSFSTLSEYHNESIYSTANTKNYLHTFQRKSKISLIESYDSVFNANIMKTNLNRQNSHLITFHKYMNSSYYAMNMQMQNKYNHSYKLEPYECEPGVCVPGQCNPLECQKLILKRLMRKASTMTSSDIRTQSISSGPFDSKSKKSQIAATKVKEGNQGVKYKTLPRTRKQVVRVGSSFKFNIEFSKNRKGAKEPLHGSKTHKIKHTSSSNKGLKRMKHSSTRGSRVFRQNRTSQSAVVMQNKGSYITPKMKRCFCTLKLQKKGRQSKTADVKDKKDLSDKQIDVKTADVAQNTKKFKPYSLSDLDPNECEPNVCVPGKCNPYECLERIKQRELRRHTKDFGTDMKTNKMSKSSITSSQKRATTGSKALLKEKPDQVFSKSVKKNVADPKRQVVRIGSSFSFDIKFYKDKSGDREIMPADLASKTRNHRHIKSKNVEKRINAKQKSVQDSKHNRQQGSQSEIIERHEKSTKTGSFLQRCFCTVKLPNETIFHKGEKTRVTEKYIHKSPSFLKRCFCVLKSILPSKTSREVKSKIEEASTFAQTKNLREKQQRHYKNTVKLEPNECEPGVCVPGECDPYICEERIRKRNANINKMSSVDRPITRSTSTFTKAATVINASIQNKNKTIKPRLKNSERSVVRIGSNFSFDVEFYKERNPPSDKVQRAAKSVKQIKHPKKVATKNNMPRTAKDRGVRKTVSVQNRESQVDHIGKENKASGVAPILKRCFCTLALGKQTPRKIKENGIRIEMVSKGTDTPTKMKTTEKYKSKRRLSNLESYECEPGICVPEMCDPYECERLIMKRKHLRRESATETMKNFSKFATTMKKDIGTRHKGQNMKTKEYHKKRDNSKNNFPCVKSKNSKISNNSAMQVVRIGSNFSFNIEFSKTHPDSIDSRSPRNVTKRSKSQPISRPSVSSKHQKTQGTKNVRHVDSQVLAKKKKSTITETPFLKRCFCTIKLKNSKGNPMVNVEKIKPIPKTEPKVRMVSQFSATKNSVLRALEPHECEPGTCVPGKCDPHQCLKRINKRMQSKMTNTNQPRRRKNFTETSKNIGAKMNQIDRRQSNTSELGKVKKQTLQAPNNINKQAVRLGSNFSFNIEFFKDTSLDNARRENSPRTNTTIDVGKSEMIQKFKSHQVKSVLSGNQSNLVDRQLQSNAYKTKSKATGIGSLMKRCFCTLKLQNVGRQNQIIKIKPDTKMKDNSASARLEIKIKKNNITKDAGTRIKNTRRLLEPYECEPKTCIPGECNPLECYERIKRRGLSEFGTNVLPTTKSVASMTGDRKMKLKEMQTRVNKRHITNSKNNHSKRKNKPISHTLDNSYRQSVAFGSNFNFDIQFYKESAMKDPNITSFQTPSKDDTHYKKKKKAIKTKSQGLSGASTSVNQTTQAGILQESRASSISPLLKRCFCTLTLHNTETNKITMGQTSKMSAQNKSTSTKLKLKDLKIKIPNDLDPNECEPGLCIPGQCDPYQCLERIKRRGIHRKSRTTGTCENQCSKSSFTTQFRPKCRTERIQPEYTKTPTIIEQPRFPFIDPKNWQGVRIGSNFSFDIEFYKENLLPSAIYNSDLNDKYDIDLKDDITPIHHSMNSAKTNNTKMKNCEIETQKLRAQNKASIAGKALKRCFCTAKFHPKKNYENVVTVGRVDNVITTSPFMPTSYFVYQLQKNGLMCPVDCLKTEMKSAGTKINNKYLDQELSLNDKRQINAVKNTKHIHKKIKKIKSNNITSRSGNKDPKLIPNDKPQDTIPKEKHKHEPSDMKTIMPYAPRKFNKNESKTLITLKARRKKNDLCSNSLCRDHICKENFDKTRESSKVKAKFTKSPKRLSGKESKHKLSQPHPTKTVLKQFLCTCLQVFSKQKNRNVEHTDSKLNVITDYENASRKPHTDALKKSKSDRCPDRCAVMDQPKKSKSLKSTKKYVRSEEQSDRKNKYSTLQSGDAVRIKQTPKLKSKKINHKNSDKSLVCPHCQGFIRDGQTVKVTFSEPPPTDNKKKNMEKNVKNQAILRSVEDTVIHPSYKLKGKVLETNPKKDNAVGILAECCSKWSECRDKIINSIKQEINNQKGDLHGKDSSNNSTISHNMPCHCCSCKSCNDNMNNQKPVGAKVTIKGKNRRKGQAVEKAKSVMGQKGNFNLKSKKPCICGSSICAKESKKHKKTPLKTGIMKNVKIKPCVCGSSVCDREAKKISKPNAKAKGKKRSKDSKDNICVCDTICECENYRKNAKKKNKKAELERNKKMKKNTLRKKGLQQTLRQLAQRRKMYQKEDAERRRLREKKDKKLMRDLKKYQDTSDTVLVAESLFDIAKLGCTTVGDVLRSTFRTVTDPKRTLQGMKTAVTNPSRACKDITMAISDSGVGSTFKRVKLRLGSMSSVKSAKTKMEECPAANYLIHINDKDPKKKHNPRKKKKVRVPLDFNCSLYMGSLRKKPWLAVYYACPWFYPHCLSMLNIWRQFTDIMLFLLAVVVWSPCIFLMEGCRAAMCCLLCTG